MFKHALVITLAFTTFAGVAVAQTAQTPPSPPAPAPSAAVGSMFPLGGTSRFMSQDLVTRFANQNFTDQARIKASPAEWRRANQAAVLINNQHCANAYTLAVVELDDRLAENVKRVCRQLAQQ